MKKNKTLQIAAGIILLAISISAGASLAWFRPTTKIGNQGETNIMPIDGSSSSGYFARGDGSSDNPFVIKTPRHLYNLAWLQYLGFFNNDDSPFYFLLEPADSKTLDMSGWVLPPIGTSKYPFIGNFNGNNKTIENLTIDNVVAANHIEQRPSIITSDSVDSNNVLKTYQANATNPFLSDTVDIVGLFGILGTYTGMVPVSANYSDVNIVSDLAIDNITINSASSKTLVGMACGYDNAALDKIAVDNSTINVASNSTPITSISSNISNYSLVGYATESAISKCYYRADKVSLPTVVNPNTNMGGNNWGGSIAMKDIYDQLRDIRDNEISYSAATHPTTQTKINGVLNPDLTTTENVYISNVSNDANRTYYHQYHTGDFKNEDGRVYASFTLARRATTANPTTTYGDDEANNNDHVYACLDGVRSKEMTTTTYNLTTVTNVPTNSTFRISDGKGNYLAYSDYGLSNTTTFSSASQWTYDNNNRIVLSNQTRYLRNNQGSLATTTDNTSNVIVWNISNEGVVSSVYNNNTYYLTYSNNSWRLVTATNGYYISDGSGNYLSAGSGTEPINQTSQNNATVWVDSGTYLYAQGSTNKRIRRSNSGQLSISDGNSRLFTIYGSTLRNQGGGGTTYYVNYNGSAWTVSTTSQTLTFVPVSFTPPKLSFVTAQSTSTENKTYSTKPTFFPLLMEPDTYKPMDGYMESEDSQKQYNTGYVISGRNINTTSNFQNYTGDIRFAGFPYNSNSTNSSSNSLSKYTSERKVYTRTRYLDDNGTLVDPGWVTISTQDTTFANTNLYHLSKFKKSFNTFNNTLQESATENFIYGVHFMDATITNDASHKVIIPEAKVLDKPATLNPDTHQYEDHISTYQNYEAPQDSIDFYLKSYGFINFFAGTYFSGTSGNNNSFFSLNHIIRSNYTEPTENSEGSSKISAIKRIAKIYSPVDSEGKNVAADDEHPYVYLYGDNTYSSTGTATAPAHLGKEIFNTDWIEQPSRSSAGSHSITMYTLYYFEIPVNAGEYALGSVSGTNGCYLNYLDIGAGAPTYKDVEMNESILSDFTNMSYPLGVDFADLDVDNIPTVIAAIVGGYSAAIVVKEATGTDVTYSFVKSTNSNASSLTITKPGNDPPDLKLSFKAGDVNVFYGSSEMSVSSLGIGYSILFERETKDHYGIISGSGVSTKTIEEKYSIGQQEAGTTIQLPNNGANYSVQWTVVTGEGAGTATASVSEDGLVTFQTAGTAVVEASWKIVTSLTEDQTWDPAPNNNAEGVETDPIIVWHFTDMTGKNVTPPNVVVSYEYSGSNQDSGAVFYYDITINNTSGRNLLFVIDSIKLSYASEEDATYFVRVHYGDQVVTLDSQTGQIIIPTPTNG